MLSSSSSSSAATVRVDKATSDLLIGPDWTMNIDICDSINTNHWQAKDVVKAVKRRIQHRNPKVQLLALTLLETMVKNCGDYVHFQIAERNILQEMIKIVKKKTDMNVRDKILALLSSWQEAFGGPGGKHPQYYWAYEELRRSGIEFPQRSSDAAPIFTPPVSHPTLGPQAGYGMPSNSSRRLDEAMASEIESLSLSSLDTMRDVMDLLSDMLQAVNPSDRMAVKDEVIVDLVSQCRSNQKKLMQMLTSTGDEELLGRGLELNDSLQSLLARYDAIASGLPLPTQVTNFSPQPTEAVSSSSKPNEVRDSSPRPNMSLVAPVAAVRRNHFEEDEEEEDDFSQLARRHSKPQSGPSQSTGTSEGSTSLISSNTTTSSAPTASIPSLSNALTLPDPPAPVRTTKEQDIIDLLSITLSTTSPHTPHAPHTPHTPAATQNVHQAPIAPSTPGYPHASQPYPGNQGQVPYNSYVVPWAQAQPQPQPQHQPQPQPQPQHQPQPQPQPQHQPQHQPQPQPQPQPQHQPQPQPQPQPQAQPQVRPQYPQYQYSSGYPPPPWAATPGYANNQSSLSTTTTSSTPQANISASYMPMQQGVRPLQQHNSFPTRGSNGSLMHGDPRMSSTPRNPAPSAGQATFIPSYRLFEDLNVFGNADGKLKMTSSTSPSLSGTSGQGMVGGRK